MSCLLELIFIKQLTITLISFFVEESNKKDSNLCLPFVSGIIIFGLSFVIENEVLVPRS